MHDCSARRFIWGSLAVQLVGYIYDAVWHGLLRPGFEPATRAEMARHLMTVHFPLYLGAAGVLVSTAVALLAGGRRLAGGRALPVAFAGALLSAGAEAWHASSHLALDTHSAPVAGILSVIGFVVVLVSMSLSRRPTTTGGGVLRPARGVVAGVRPSRPSARREVPRPRPG